MATRHETLVSRGDTLFTEKRSLNSLHQEIADHFYPERADFTTSRYLGADFAANMTTSYPMMVRRELGNAISAILRPSEMQWFKVSVSDEDKLDQAGKEWLDMATKRLRNAMYDRVAGLIRACREGDHDFTTFGQCVISIDFNEDTNAMLYRTWHLRDCAWTENVASEIGEINMNWRPKIRDLVEWFGKENLHANVQKAAEPEPNRRIPCRRVVLPASEYHMPGQPWRFKWVSVYVDLENNHPMQEKSTRTRGLIVPRWQTAHGSQYAFSPATVVALPDARLIQAMALTLLEAGEMAVRPPLAMLGDITREDFNYYAGGMTHLDVESGKRVQDVIGPIRQSMNGFPVGMDMEQDKREMLAQAFYLNRLNLPPPDGQMTAYETSERIKEYVRASRPLFEPMEHEYNYNLVDATFEELMPRGLFGSVADIPDSLAGRETTYTFESPLTEANERQKGVTFMEAKELILQATEMDPASAAVMNFPYSVREALEGVRAPASWIRSEDEVQEIAERKAQLQQAQELADVAGNAGAAAQQLADASQSL